MPFIENKKNSLVYMTASNIDATHAFTTRFGGASNGIYSALNLAQRSGDKPENVRDNYSRLCRALDISTDDIVCSNQVHGTHVRIATCDDRAGLFMSNAHQADALITQTPGVALMVFTADCVPILLFDPVKNAAGAVHAGWRGTAAAIAGITVRHMVSRFGCSPGDIRAAIGPCISKCCFETKIDVADALSAAIPEAADTCIAQQGEKYLIDLKAANRVLLANAGLCDIVISDECTVCSSDKYWSHRKTNGQRGSQAAVIVSGHLAPRLCEELALMQSR